MEERGFLHEICLTALYTIKAISFAAIVDTTGQLIVVIIREAF